MHTANCANCEAPLTGPYCSQCGQHAHESSRSIGTLFHDAWHVVTHVDGRFWQTIGALLFKPGKLTAEYFAERRARYLPPVRLYLVLSLVFFAFASLGSRTAHFIDLDSKPPAKRLADTASQAEADGVTGAVEDAKKIGAEIDAAVKQANQQQKPKADAAAGADEDNDKDGGFTLDLAKCDSMRSDWKWLEQPMRDTCRRNVADHGHALGTAVVASIPKMMFVFLPIMALVMLLLYWWPRRYYVEHVVFFLHTHAAIFLVLLLELVVSRLAHWLPLLSPVIGWVVFAGFIYSSWYIYRAMRVFYGQGRWLTLTKIFVIGITYLLFLSITIAATTVLLALVT